MLASALVMAGCRDVLNIDDFGPYPLPTLVCDAALAGRDDCEGPYVGLFPAPFVLRGSLHVLAGGVLQIPAGTSILSDDPSSRIVVEPGGRLLVDGTEDAPVVFTSLFVVDPSTAEYHDGGWQGISISGDGKRVTYARIEHAGYTASECYGGALELHELGSDNEIHHVEIHASERGFSLCPAFELSGGDVDAHHLLVTRGAADAFRIADGWHGRGQFWLAQMDPEKGDEGLEADGTGSSEPIPESERPTLANVTLVGGGGAGAGILLRNGVGATLINAIALSFGSTGLDLDDPETAAQIDAGTLSVHHSIIFASQPLATDADGIDEEDVFLNRWAGNRVVDPGLADAADYDNPDFRPAPGSAAASGWIAPPDDGFFEPVDYIGAVGPGAEEWYRAHWTTLGAPS